MNRIDRAELDAVRNHISNIPSIGAMYAPVLVEHSRSLLDEVERLTAENDRLCLAVPRIIQVNDTEADRAFDALQPSLGTPVPPERRIRRQADVDAAFARGAEAMRQAVIGLAEPRATLPVKDGVDAAWCRSAQCIVDDVRVMPVPEDR